MNQTQLDELESAHIEYLAAQSRWRLLLRQHDIAENQLLVGKSFTGYIHDRDCDRYAHVRSVDPFGNLIGDTISFYDMDTVDLKYNTTIKRNDIDVMDEIPTSDYINCLLEINAKNSRVADQLS